MARRKSSGRRENHTGSVFLHRGRYAIRYKDPVTAKYRIKVLSAPDASGALAPITTLEKAKDAAVKFMAPIQEVSSIESKAELMVKVAESKQLIRKATGLELAKAWEVFLVQHSRPDSGDATLREYRLNLERFIKWLASARPAVNRVAEVDSEIALAYFTYVWNSGISASSHNSYLQALALIFRVLGEPAGLVSNPFTGITKKTKEVVSRREFTPAQVEAIFKGFETGFFYETEKEILSKGRERKRKKVICEYVPLNKDQMRVLLNICCWTGARGQDGALMKWEAISFDTGEITYRPMKTARKTQGRTVCLPIHPALRVALQDALAWCDTNREGEDYIIPAVAARYQSNHSGLQKDVMKIIRISTGLDTTAADAPGRRKLAANAYSLHSFRHSFVSFCANAGVPLAVVAEIVGHGNPAMTRHYSHISKMAKAEAIGALPMLGGSPATGNALADGVVDVNPITLKPSKTSSPSARARLEGLLANASEEELQRLLALAGKTTASSSFNPSKQKTTARHI